MHLDADERIGNEAIKDVLGKNKKALYKFTRSYVFGKKFKYGVLAPDTVLRMYHLGIVA